MLKLRGIFVPKKFFAYFAAKYARARVKEIMKREVIGYAATL